MPLDTLAYARTLEAAGLPRAQAEAHAQALADFVSTELVTKADLVRIEERLAQCATKADLEALRSQVGACATKTDLATLRGEMLGMRGELLSALERVYADNARLETRLTRYVLVSSTIVGLIAALGLAAKWL